MKKSSREKLVDMLLKASNCRTDSELAKSLGVNKQKVSYWRSEKGSLDYDLLLNKFGRETLKFLSNEYGIGIVNEKDEREEKAGKLLAEAIQLLSEQKKGKSRLAAEESGSYKAITESVPLYQHLVAAGPCADSTGPIEEHFDLPGHMIPHPQDTYAVKVTGDSMKGDKIEEGDILIVDCALEPQHKNVVIASVDNEQTVKRLKTEGGKVTLMPSNHHYEPIEITKDMDFRIQGVVTWVIRQTA